MRAVFGAEIPELRIPQVVRRVHVEEPGDLRRRERERAVDVRGGEAVIHAGLGFRQVLRRHRRHPGEPVLRAGRPPPARLAGGGRRQLVARQPHGVAEAVYGDNRGDDANGLHIFAVAQAAGQGLFAEAPGQAAGVGADAVDDLHQRLRQVRRPAVRPGCGMGRERRPALAAEPAGLGRAGLLGNGDADGARPPFARRRQPGPGAPLGRRQIAAHRQGAQAIVEGLHRCCIDGHGLPPACCRRQCTTAGSRSSFDMRVPLPL